MADIAELIVALKLQDGVSRGLGNLNRQLGGMQGGLSQVSRGIGQVGAGLGTLATRGAIAATAVGTGFITTAASMEEAFTGVEKTVDGSESQLEALRQQLRGMSSDTGTSFEELSRVGEMGGALGVGVEDLDEFIDVVNRLSVSTDLTSETAATALGQLGTILHLTGADYEDFADTLVALGNAGASTEPQIVEMAARFAAAGNRAGLSSDEILALSSAVSSMGVDVEAGGTALSQTFNEIALGIGTGSKEAVAFADVLGLSAGEFRRAWETDALGTFQDFLQEISKLDPIAQAVALEMAGITGARQLSAVGLMADNWQFVGEQVAVANNATGELKEESDKFFGTSAAGFRKVRENVRLAADSIGTEMLPVVNELITEFVGFMQDPAQQQALKEFGTGLAGGLRDFVTEIRQVDWGPMLAGLEGAGTLAKGFFDLFKSLPPELQAILVGGFAVNKLSGGLLTGVGNILLGSLRTIMAGNVTVIGANVTGGPGGPTGPGGGMFSWLKTAATVAAVAAARVAPALLLSGSDNPNAEMSNRQIELQRQINEGAITSAEAARLWSKAYGEITANPFRVDISSAGKKFGTGTSEWAQGLNDVMKQTGTSDWARGLNKEKVEAVLPDTAMQPLISPITALTSALSVGDYLHKGERGGFLGREPGNFVPTVKLDPSQVTDLRGQVSAIHELKAIFPPFFGGFRSDANAQLMAIDRVNATMNLERAATAGYQAADATRIQSLRDSHTVAIAGVTARLDTANIHLSGLGPTLSTFARLREGPPTIINNTISSTVIQQQTAQTRALSGLTENRF